MNIVLLVVTLLSLTLAATMSVVAWKAANEARRRSDARVAALEAEIIEERGPAVGAMFADRDQSEEPSALPLPVALLVALTLILSTIGGIAMLSSHSTSRGAAAANRPAPSNEAPLLVPPIELVSLDHERTRDHFVIHGVVHNPVDGREQSHVAAVVLLYNTDGSFAGTGRAELIDARLEPGNETAFSISVPGSSPIGRYRVSFKTDDDRVIPHVDKRHGA